MKDFKADTKLNEKWTPQDFFHQFFILIIGYNLQHKLFKKLKVIQYVLTVIFLIFSTIELKEFSPILSIFYHVRFTKRH